MNIIYFITSSLFWGFVLVTSMIFLPISFIIKMLTFPFDKNLKALHLFASLWASLYTWVSPLWHVKIIDKNKIDQSKTYIMVSNHFSVADIFAVFRLMVHFKWVSKVENFSIPFIGWNMTLNQYIRLDRGSTKGQGQMMKDSERMLNQGSSVMIFPEGTRSTTDEVRDFKNGAFELALRTKLPILPIVIEGSQKALPKKGILIKGSHHITIKVLDPIPHEVYGDRDVSQIAKDVRQLIANELDTIRNK